jgi:ATP-dependent Lon protease
MGLSIPQGKCLHIHVPAGAIPKDGPSAGITIVVSIYSLLANKVVREDLAMTGEITLRGVVLPVGGIKEKVLAAKRSGLTRVLLPKMNEKDLKDIDADVIKDIELAFVENIDEVLKLAFPDTGIDPVSILPHLLQDQAVPPKLRL